jgi:hypothetical protein
MQSTRVLLAEAPGLLGEVIRQAVDGASDLELLVSGTAIEHADVLVTTSEDYTLPPAIGAVARLRVLTIDCRDQRGALYRLDPSRAELGELSLAELADAIRDASRAERSAVFNWQPTG